MNIIGQLEREYSGKPDELRKFIHDLVEHAGNYLEFDPQAVILGVGKAKVSQFLVNSAQGGGQSRIQRRFEKTVP